MKNLKFESMLLVSHQEKRAKKLEFDPKMTVIQGENDTGKSSIIKNLVATFGAEPHKVHKDWKKADIRSLVRFSVDNMRFAIYRHRDSFSLFNQNNVLIGTYNRVTTGLAPALAKILDFQLKLVDQQGVSRTPTPAFYLLPFYIDQDKGWTDSWCSFTKLKQFKFWQDRVIGYHFGIKPDEWYALSAEKKDLEAQKDAPLSEINTLDSLRYKTHSELSSVDFNFDLEQFRKEIDDLVRECSQLRKAENSYKKQISDLATEEIRLQAQIDIVVKTHDELSKDYEFSQNLEASEVSCPTCGVLHENSFKERFSIAQDTETCTDLLTSLRDDLNKIRSNITKAQEQLFQSESSRSRINSILARQRGKLKLSEIIEIEGKRALLKNLHLWIAQQKEYLGGICAKVDAVEREMKKFEDPARVKNIKEKWERRFSSNSISLGVTTLGAETFKKINPSIDESGSDLPRALLAYFFAVLSMIKDKDSSTFFPIIIDAPNQQEQDAKNLKKLLEFIREKRPDGAQMIVGLVDTNGVALGGRTIRLDKKYEALSAEDYESLAEEMSPFEKANLAMSLSE